MAQDIVSGIDSQPHDQPEPSHLIKARNIPIEQIIDLRKKNLTHNQIAQLLGIARETVSRRLADVDLEGLELHKRHKGDVLAWHQRRLLNSITDDDIKAANVVQKTTAYGILFDKERLERGQSTENISVHNLNSKLEDLEAEESRLKAALAPKQAVVQTEAVEREVKMAYNPVSGQVEVVDEESG